MFRTTFLKPVGKIEEGSSTRAIIAYRKIPWTMKDAGNKVTVIQHKYYIQINLWFVIFDIIWLWSNNK